MKALWHMPFPRIGARSDELDDWISELNLTGAYYAGFASTVLMGGEPRLVMDFGHIVNLSEEFERIVALGKDDPQKIEVCDRYLKAVEAVADGLKKWAETHLDSTHDGTGEREIEKERPGTTAPRSSAEGDETESRTHSKLDGHLFQLYQLANTSMPKLECPSKELRQWVENSQPVYRKYTGLAFMAAQDQPPIFPIDVLDVDLTEIQKLRDEFDRLVASSVDAPPDLEACDEYLQMFESSVPGLEAYIEEWEDKFPPEED